MFCIERIFSLMLYKNLSAYQKQVSYIHVCKLLTSDAQKPFATKNALYSSHRKLMISQPAGQLTSPNMTEYKSSTHCMLLIF